MQWHGKDSNRLKRVGVAGDRSEHSDSEISGTEFVGNSMDKLACNVFFKFFPINDFGFTLTGTEIFQFTPPGGRTAADVLRKKFDLVGCWYKFENKIIFTNL